MLNEIRHPFFLGGKLGVLGVRNLSGPGGRGTSISNTWDPCAPKPCILTSGRAGRPQAFTNFSSPYFSGRGSVDLGAFGSWLIPKFAEMGSDPLVN